MQKCLTILLSNLRMAIIFFIFLTSKMIFYSTVTIVNRLRMKPAFFSLFYARSSRIRRAQCAKITQFLEYEISLILFPHLLLLFPILFQVFSLTEILQSFLNPNNKFTKWIIPAINNAWKNWISRLDNLKIKKRKIVQHNLRKTI